MADQRLIDFIDRSRAKGFSDSQIRSQLAQVGWSESQVDDAFQMAKSAPVSPPKQPVQETAATAPQQPGQPVQAGQQAQPVQPSLQPAQQPVLQQQPLQPSAGQQVLPSVSKPLIDFFPKLPAGGGENFPILVLLGAVSLLVVVLVIGLLVSTVFSKAPGAPAASGFSVLLPEAWSFYAGSPPRFVFLLASNNSQEMTVDFSSASFKVLKAGCVESAAKIEAVQDAGDAPLSPVEGQRYVIAPAAKVKVSGIIEQAGNESCQGETGLPYQFVVKVLDAKNSAGEAFSDSGVVSGKYLRPLEAVPTTETASPVETAPPAGP